MRYYAAALAVVLAAMLATPAQAAEPCDEACKVKCKTVVVNAGDDEKSVVLDEGEGGKVITISEDGKKKVLKLKGGQLLDVDDKLDTEVRLRLLDANIAHLKATGQLKTDLAIKRAEVEKLELAKKPDAEITAKRKEVNALKAKLADARLDYEQAVKKLVPDDMYELYMLGIGDEADLLELSLGLPAGGEKRIIRRIEVRADEEEGDWATGERSTHGGGFGRRRSLQLGGVVQRPSLAGAIQCLTGTCYPSSRCSSGSESVRSVRRQFEPPALGAV